MARLRQLQEASGTGAGKLIEAMILNHTKP
jgi:hypothetical protein